MYSLSFLQGHHQICTWSHPFCRVWLTVRHALQATLEPVFGLPGQSGHPLVQDNEETVSIFVSFVSSARVLVCGGATVLTGLYNTLFAESLQPLESSPKGSDLNYFVLKL